MSDDELVSNVSDTARWVAVSHLDWVEADLPGLIGGKEQLLAGETPPGAS